MDAVVAWAIVAVIAIVCIGLLPIRVRGDWWDKIRRGRGKRG